MKKFLALLLTLAMVLSLFAGCNNATVNDDTQPTEGNTTPSGDNDNKVDTPDVNNTYYVDDATNTVYAGSANLVLNENAGGGEVGYDVYAGIAGKDYTDPEYYTMVDYTSGMTDLKWSTHTWETSDDDNIVSYITSPYYTFRLNSTADGWSIACEMAAALPEDVTSQYVGQYGIEEGDTQKAWKIALREDLCWEDGTPINADSFIYSAQELLDPVMLNRRADSLYAGDFQIYGAKNYFYSGRTVYGNVGENGITKDDLVLGDDGVYTYNGEPVVINVGGANDYHLGGNSLNAYVSAYGEQYFGMDHWDELVAACDADGNAPLTEETYAWLLDVVTANAGWGEDESYVPNYCYVNIVNPEYGWEGVGFFKDGDYALVMVATTPVENPNYYVPYNTSSAYLVHEELWESCKTYWDSKNNKVDADSDDIASITTNYCTSAETTMSFGPYRMDYFELDKQYNLTRNDKWYGYSDGNHTGMYQTDEYKVIVLADHNTAMMAFAAGEIDGVSLQAEDLETYGNSENLLYTPQTYTTKISFNTNLESLEAHGTNSQVLTNRTLRQAISLAIDRGEYCSSLTAGHLPGFGLLNNMYVYDPFSGATYRDTDAAKEALVQLFGLTYGDDGDYGDLDEAYEALTGYDPAAAKELMQKAYDECVASGLYDGTSPISLEFCVYSSDEIYIKIFNFLNDAIVAATVGTDFEGKLTLTMKEDADYYNTMYSGNTDVIFTTWGGAAYSPYTILDQCYCDASDGSGNQMEYGFETDKYMVCINVDGHDITTDLQTWAGWAGGKDVTITSDDGELTLDRFGNYDADSRSAMYAKMEYAFLASYTTFPLYYRNSVSVFSKKINYATTKYVDLVGYGGLEYVTYNYTDAEWAEVASTIVY